LDSRWRSTTWSSRRRWPYTECFGFTLEEIGAEGAASLETKLRSAGLPIEELPGPPIFSPGMSIQERSDNAMRLVWAGILGEKTGPPKRDPETMAALFRMVEGGMATNEAPPGTLQWEFPDADPWHLVVANGESRVEPGRAADATATLHLRYEDWADLVAGRLDPRKLALRGRLRPSGDLRWLWRARMMFPRWCSPADAGAPPSGCPGQRAARGHTRHLRHRARARRSYTRR